MILAEQKLNNINSTGQKPVDINSPPTKREGTDGTLDNISIGKLILDPSEARQLEPSTASIAGHTQTSTVPLSQSTRTEKTKLSSKPTDTTPLNLNGTPTSPLREVVKTTEAGK